MWSFVLKTFGFRRRKARPAKHADPRLVDLRQDWNGTVLSLETYR